MSILQTIPCNCALHVQGTFNFIAESAAKKSRNTKATWAIAPLLHEMGRKLSHGELRFGHSYGNPPRRS